MSAPCTLSIGVFSCAAGESAWMRFANAMSYMTIHYTPVAVRVSHGFTHIWYSVHVPRASELTTISSKRRDDKPCMGQCDDEIAFMLALRITQPLGQVNGDLGHVLVLEVRRPRRNCGNPFSVVSAQPPPAGSPSAMIALTSQPGLSRRCGCLHARRRRTLEDVRAPAKSRCQ